MIETPSILTESGDIRLHNLEGARIPIFFQDDEGADRDMSSATVWFRTQHDHNIQLVAGVANNELVLNIPPAFFVEHVGKKLAFVVTDETIAEHPAIWRGDVIVEGWA